MASNKNVRKQLNLSAASTGHDQLSILSEQESVIANLMNLPVAEDETKSVPIVKVDRQMLFCTNFNIFEDHQNLFAFIIKIFVGYKTRIIEHKCEV